MSEANVAGVRTLYEAWSDGSFRVRRSSSLPTSSTFNGASAVEPGTRHGQDQFGSALEKVFAGWERWEMTPERLESAADRVAVVVRYRARGRSSGAEIEGRESAFWTA